MSTLVIRLTRLSPTQHRFEAIRADGSRETRELETKSLLRHDLVHFAVESEAGLQCGFYGRLARGEADDDLSSEASAIERIVGALQGASKGEVDPEDFISTFQAYERQLGAESAPWLTAELIGRVLARLRRLEGQWRATPFHHTLELRFETD